MSIYNQLPPNHHHLHLSHIQIFLQIFQTTFFYNIFKTFLGDWVFFSRKIPSIFFKISFLSFVNFDIIYITPIGASCRICTKSQCALYKYLILWILLLLWTFYIFFCVVILWILYTYYFIFFNDYYPKH